MVAIHHLQCQAAEAPPITLVLSIFADQLGN